MVIQVFPDILVQGHQDILATVAFLDILGYRVILVIQDSVDTQAQADIQVQADILERAVIQGFQGTQALLGTAEFQAIPVWGLNFLLISIVTVLLIIQELLSLSMIQLIFLLWQMPVRGGVIIGPVLNAQLVGTRRSLCQGHHQQPEHISYT